MTYEIKLRNRIWSRLVSISKNRPFYPYLYKSVWCSKFLNGRKGECQQYFSSLPNPGAGIGHQLANWIAGYWWAKYFELKFAHLPFSNEQWDAFFGFGQDEVMVNELIAKGFKKVRLPLFSEDKPSDLLLTKKIIQSYSGKKVVFVCEQDQFYKDQYGVIKDIQRKFYSSQSRKNDQLLYSKYYFNIAIHVRRGDIVIDQKNQNPNLKMRWQDNNYFINVLSNVLKTVKTENSIAIYLFSQGVENDFEDFKQFSNLHFCLEMSAQDSFLHMANADLLITSKSSFSYKPALLNRGIKVCPKVFWHGYPEAKDWILADEYGNFE